MLAVSWQGRFWVEWLVSLETLLVQLLLEQPALLFLRAPVYRLAPLQASSRLKSLKASESNALGKVLVKS